MSFPPATRLALAFMLALVFGWLLGLLWRQDRQQLALKEWGIAFLLVAVAVSIRSTLGTLPEWLAIGGSNTAISLAFGCLWAGARRFAGQRPHLAVRLGGVLVSLAVLPLSLDNLTLRVMSVAAIIGGYALITAWEFRRGLQQGRLPSHPALIGVFAVFGIISLIRCLGAWLVGFDGVEATSLPVAPWNDILAIVMLAAFAAMPVMLVSIAREQAEQRSTARLTEALGQADTANRNKTRFLAQMSHELRTPLNAVFGMAQVLARDPDLAPAQRAQATTLVEAGRHLLAIVNDSLDLARVEAGRLDLAPQAVPLREMLAATLEMLAAAAAEKQLDLRLDLPAEAIGDPGLYPGLLSGALPRMVLVDPLRLRQIVVNLLGNATKFTPAGGEIVLSAAWDAATATLRISVRDTGPGIPADLRGQLFGEFAQGAEQSRSGEGSGLGLAICAALAQAMGGTLTYAPALPGSRFTLALPLALPPPLPRPLAHPLAHPLPSACQPGRALRVLVVDDVRPNRLVARALLEAAGHAVAEAADGAAAVAALQAGLRPDAVLMDVHMVPMDGHAATRQIRGLGGPLGQVPVIAMTADATPEDVVACTAAGMDGRIVKPIDRTALLAELARVTERPRLALGSKGGSPGGSSEGLTGGLQETFAGLRPAGLTSAA